MAKKGFWQSFSVIKKKKLPTFLEKTNCTMVGRAPSAPHKASLQISYNSKNKSQKKFATFFPFLPGTSSLL